MNQNIFCSKCHRIPNQCCCSSEWGMNKEIIMNPDILPTLEEWRLICKMVKQRELTDEEILDTAKTMPTIDGATMEEAYILFARAILMKASEK